MLFKRRKRLGQWHRLRVLLWPRVSWRRSLLYYAKRVLRLSGTPHAIALGAALGAFASFTPFVGLHLIFTLAVAWLLSANMIAGGLGTAIGNPLTFPLIWAGTYEIGQVILQGVSRDAPAGLEYELTNKSFAQLMPVLKPMVVGSIPLGLASGVIVYLIAYKCVSAYQTARRRRFERRLRAGRVAESGQEP